MELRVLKYFLAVAREENITKAAALLHLTQPTLSRQLMQLEEELGVQLFHRSRYRVILTEDGMLLRRRAQEIVDLAEKTAREFQRQEGELTGEIAIGSGDLQGMSYLAEQLAAFHREHPQVRYQLYSGHSDNIKERLEQGLLDFGLLLEPVDIGKYRFLSLPGVEEWGVLISEDSPLAAKASLTPEDLAGKPLLLAGRELVQQQFERWMGPLAGEADAVVRGNLPYNMAMMARQGVGAFLTIRLNCAYEGLRFIPFSPPLETGTMLVWKKDQIFSPAAEQFLRQLKESVQRDREQEK